MKFSYKFSNLLGTVYKKGNIIFSKDGNTVICPVGNKISLYDLRNSRSLTLPIQADYDYEALALSPNNAILVASIDGGMVQIINLNARMLLYRKKFDRTVTNIQFSPDGKHFAVTIQSSVLVYQTPGADKQVFNPFVLEKVISSSYEDATCLDWSYDSRLLAVGSQDMVAHVHAIPKFKNFSETTLSGCNARVVGIFFEENTYDVYSISENGVFRHFKCSVDADGLKLTKSEKKKMKQLQKVKHENDELDDFPETEEDLEAATKSVKKKDINEEKVKVFFKMEFHTNIKQQKQENPGRVTAVEFNKTTKLLVAAFARGDFVLLDMNEKAALVHSLNISDKEITSVKMNPSGDWIALGVKTVGQLLVWEWQSETYILKQQSHYSNMNVVKYSPDGQNLATGGEDGKVKLWSTMSSFSFVTFSEHSGPVTGLTFTQSGRAILSSSLDGTVRAFDLIRYRNFKTLTSPRPAQFVCVCVDSSGELVAAGGQDTYEIYIWSLKLGKLLEVLAGHTSPVVSIQFSMLPGSTMMVSTGWDSTLKVWDAILDTSAKETILLGKEGLCVAFRPDGKQVAVATLDGQISTFDPLTGRQEGTITGQAHLGAGLSHTDKTSMKKNLESKAFTAICYSADGSCIIASGHSKFVCIFSVEEELLLKRYTITKNHSFDGMQDYMDRRKMFKDDVNLALVEARDGERTIIKPPGSRRGDMSKRDVNMEVRVLSLTFSPTGHSWAACTSEGLLMYSLDDNWLFDPKDLDIASTPSAVKRQLKEKDYTTALIMALQLNINVLKQEVIETIPINTVKLVISSLTQMQVDGILKFISEVLETTPHIGLYSMWAKALVTQHGQILKTRSSQIMSTLNALQKALTTHHSNLSKVCNHNEYMLKYLLAQASLKKRRALADTDVHSGKATTLASDEEMETDKEEEALEDMFTRDDIEA